MRTLKLTLEYDGTGYQGWQFQPDKPTLQGEIEARLERILGAPHRIHGAGRTDAGVHARGQVAHFQTEHAIPALALQRALNATLPRDIAVTALCDAQEGFHARKQAHRKQYAYQILNRPVRSALLERYAWHVPQPLDFDAMARGCAVLIGEHDFAAFKGANSSAVTSVRRVYACRIDATAAPLYRVEIEGSGFLKHMVRNIVGTLVDVGLGRTSVGRLEQILASRDRRLAGKTAPARGLWLEWVRYEAESGGEGDRRSVGGGEDASADDE